MKFGTYISGICVNIICYALVYIILIKVGSPSMGAYFDFNEI